MNDIGDGKPASKLSIALKNNRVDRPFGCHTFNKTLKLSKNEDYKGVAPYRL